MTEQQNDRQEKPALRREGTKRFGSQHRGSMASSRKAESDGRKERSAEKHFSRSAETRAKTDTVKSSNFQHHLMKKNTVNSAKTFQGEASSSAAPIVKKEFSSVRYEKKNFSGYSSERRQSKVSAAAEVRRTVRNASFDSISVTPSRKAAYTVLMEVYGRGAYASLSLGRQFQDSEMKDEDRRLVSILVYGVIENTGKLDWLIDRYLHAPLNDLRQRIILRMGAYQMLFLDRVPDNAAVNECVNLCKQEKMEMSAGFINAVLRSIGREKAQIDWPQKGNHPSEYLSLMSSTPLWLVEKLTADYGLDKTEKMLLGGEESRGVVIRPNFTLMNDEQLEKKLTQKEWRWEKGIAPHSYRIMGEDVAHSKEFYAGEISIQGQSSMLAAMAMDAKLGQKLLDACSAPGGKAAYLCETMQMTGRVYAWELHEARLALLNGMKKRLHLENLRPAQYDATQLREDWLESLDGVLLDAPCSGTGVMSQKPDIKNRIRQEDIASLAEAQKKLLNTVCGYVKRGGILVYSTCSVMKDENELQIAQFLIDHPGFVLEEMPLTVPQEIRALQGTHGLQILSGELGLEGFFIARMKRVR